MQDQAANRSGGTSATRLEQRPLLDSSNLRRMFLDLLGRPPLEAERSWVGKPREAFVDAILPTEEYWKNWLEEQLYYFLLVDNFRPTTDGIRALPGLLTRREIGVREAI